MIGRRGFLGALAGLPIAVVMPSVPEGAPFQTGYAVGDATTRTTSSSGSYHYTHTIPPPTGSVTVTVSCDTTEFQREVARAQRVVDAVERRLERAAQRIPMRMERA